MSPFFKKVLIVFTLSAVPILIGLPITLSTKDPLFIELFLIITGILQLLVLNVRTSRAERKNMKKSGTYKHDKQSDNYLSFVSVQRTILLSGVINIALSIIYFLIFMY
ncbi:MAG TPA: hypothetical protein GX695_06095 [Acholeplasmataceae bacterium]|nr:hypothetical protein [Acholeplasmataceae bacterium]